MTSLALADEPRIEKNQPVEASWKNLKTIRSIRLSGSCGSNSCQPAEASAIAFPPDGDWLAYATYGWSDLIGAQRKATVRLSSWKDAALDKTVEVAICNTNSRIAVALHPDGKRLAIGGNGEILVVGLDGAKDARYPDNLLFPYLASAGTQDSTNACSDSAQVFSLAWSPDGNSLAAGMYESNSSNGPWQIEILRKDQQPTPLAFPQPALKGSQIIRLEVQGWQDENQISVKSIESGSEDDSSKKVQTLYLINPNVAGGNNQRLETIPQGAAVFVVAGKTFLLLPSGDIRKAGAKGPLAHIDLPPLAYPRAQRKILAAAALLNGRLALVYTEQVKISMGLAPCCTQLLLLAPNP